MTTEHYHTRHWPSSTMLHTATIFLGQARAKNQKGPFPFLVPSVLLSFAAVEAGVNALIDYALRGDNKVHPLVKKHIRKELKASPPASIVDKMLYFTHLLTGSNLDPQSSLWARFQSLRKLRNRIIHYELEGLSDQETQKLAENLPIKSSDGRPSSEILKEDFYKNLFSREVTTDRVQEAIETAHEIIDNLHSFYGGIR